MADVLLYGFPYALKRGSLIRQNQVRTVFLFSLLHRLVIPGEQVP